jgi:hypothetical protein
MQSERFSDQDASGQRFVGFVLISEDGSQPCPNAARGVAVVAARLL